MSILQGSTIDSERLQLFLTGENLEQVKENIALKKIYIQTLALQAYWSWFTLGHQVKTQQDLLNLALQRRTKIRKRIKAGDLAKIYEIENQQYVLKRKTLLTKSLNDFQKAVQELSLFYRSSDGKPILVSDRELPDLEDVKITSPHFSQESMKRTLEVSPELKILKSQARQVKRKIDFSKNLFLPNLDLKYEYTNDSGAGARSLTGAENKLFITLSMPLTFNKARSTYKKNKAKLDTIKSQIDFINQKISVKLNQLQFGLKNKYDIFNMTREQIKLNKKLVTAEQQKFNNGESDLILVNLREQNYAQAQVENLKALYEYKLIYAYMKELLLEFI